MIDLSIILVNWNSIAFAEQCIASIQSTVQGLQYEIIVVDNASADAPCQRLSDRFPTAELLLSGTNLGFGGANNLGARQSSGQVLLFLNPDTLLRDDAVHRMFQHLVARPEAGAAGCRLLNADLTLQTSCVQNFPTVLNQLLGLGALQRLCPTLPLWGKRCLYVREKPVQVVDVVSGACLMIRREIFEEAGGFSPAYFMFAEEVDLCFRIHASGKQVLHCSEAEVIHFGGQSTGQREDGFADVAMRDSVYRFLLQTRGRGDALLFRLGLALSAILRVGLLAPALMFARVLNKQRWVRRASKVRQKWIRIGRWSLHPGKLQSRPPAPERSPSLLAGQSHP